jgi:hypothetical protein
MSIQSLKEEVERSEMAQYALDTMELNNALKHSSRGNINLLLHKLYSDPEMSKRFTDHEKQGIISEFHEL